MLNIINENDSLKGCKNKSNDHITSKLDEANKLL
jgi:hypothetical protein